MAVVAKYNDTDVLVARFGRKIFEIREAVRYLLFKRKIILKYRGHYVDGKDFCLRLHRQLNHFEAEQELAASLRESVRQTEVQYVLDVFLALVEGEIPPKCDLEFAIEFCTRINRIYGDKAAFGGIHLATRQYVQ